MVKEIPELECYVGDTTVWPVEITADGVAVDITEHTLSWLVTAARTGTALLQVDVTEHSHADAGLSALELTAANLTAIGGAGDYWLTGIDVDGDDAELTRVVARLSVLDRPQRTVSP
jgi:hypothetical protein